MAIVKPFKAYRPVPDKVHLVASRSYISYKTAELKRKLDENPFSFLHIINPEYRQSKKLIAGSIEHNRRARKKFEEFVEEGIFLREEERCFYIYRQIKEENTYTGIIGCASVDDYNNNVIKKHEATITKKEVAFKNYLKEVKINAEPVCFTYPNSGKIDEVVAEQCLLRPEYDFTTSNRVRHTLWKISNQSIISEIEKEFSIIPALYIADGHHRSASSALLGEEFGKSMACYNYFMGIFIPERGLKVYEFNRLVKSIGKYSSDSLVEELKIKFHVEEIFTSVFKPEKNHEIGMYIDRKWYCLVPKKDTYDENNLVGSLDVSILSDNILGPILEIEDLKTDKRISFMGGLEDIKKLMDEVDSGNQAVAFTHYPVSMEQLKNIADANLIMPPKSTWIEPKLRSGLSMYGLSGESL